MSEKSGAGSEPGTGANLMEIFASVQGEGLFVGRPCVFVRFGGCDLRCSWCDTPKSWRRAEECRIERTAAGEEDVEPNPLSLERIEAAVRVLLSPHEARVSFTGGEPLLQADAVALLATSLQSAGIRVHLETHGLAVDALDRVVDHVDWVAMDWKLAGDVRRAAEPAALTALELEERHGAFLELAHRRSRVFVKVVVTPATERAQLERICGELARIAPDVALVLQPVTPIGVKGRGPDASQLLGWLHACQRLHRDVRIIPQTHRVYGAR